MQSLVHILSSEFEDPTWMEGSLLHELFQQRIPIVEFISLFTSDAEWSHMADKAHTAKVLELFDKVYGYEKGLSRLEEQNKRYQKQQNLRKKDDQKKEQDNNQEAKNEKNVLNELFGVK